MSAVQLQELCDDHILDSNWKKLTNIGLEEIKSPYEELTDSIDEENVKMWLNEESRALSLRGEHLDIYAARVKKAPSLADIWLSLMSSPSVEQANPGSIS
ncbi:hypothetical protein PAXRUDRAFT_16759 [Paxillus rubicundulus Ve08.2h10]|uniref:Uncharacterized protein n=1 Tax=Paxillus rubicundulus Ve08.2h10 TaxID=930991 RepID=A0A0D0DD94_9AGAM|nr:hypothetical protein PAXRUDRAFT_16759 [Paxillus rubicundulus Ve08.2h10]